MYAVVTCPSCEQRMRLEERFLGRTVKCPKCATPFATPVPISAEPVPEAPSPAPRPKRPRAVPPPLPAGFERKQPRQSEVDEEPFEPRRRLAPSRAEDFDDQEPPPRRRGAAAPRGFRPLQLPLKVVKDPAKLLKGNLKAEVTADGLVIFHKKGDLLVPLGAEAKYLNDNKFTVSIDDREVTLAVTKFGAYQARLAQDVVLFLGGKKERLRAKDYSLPIGLQVLAFLPIGIPVIAITTRIIGGNPEWEGTWGSIWAGIWGGLGGGLIAACYAIAQRHQWSRGGRAGAQVGLACLGYLALVGGLLFTDVLATPRIDSTAWREFTPPDGRFSILMPGTAATQQQFQPGWKEVFTAHIVDLKKQNRDFGVSHCDLPPNELKLVPIEQRFLAARDGMLAKTPGGNIISEAPIRLNNRHPGWEYILKVTQPRGQMIVRAYLVENRFYILSAGGAKMERDSEDAQKFFSSFRPKETQAAAPQ
jgi:hypothetical protein